MVAQDGKINLYEFFAKYTQFLLYLCCVFKLILKTKNVRSKPNDFCKRSILQNEKENPFVAAQVRRAFEVQNKCSEDIDKLWMYIVTNWKNAQNPQYLQYNCIDAIDKEIRPVAEVGKKGEGIENKEEMGEE